MKTKAKHKKYLIALLVQGFLLVLLEYFKQSPTWVEQYYSQQFYPWFAYLPKALFGMLPFSVGDILYLLLGGGLLWNFLHFCWFLGKAHWQQAQMQFLRCLLLALGAYLYFYISWGLQYYRIPLQQQLGLQIDSISHADYLQLVDRYINQTNQLRAQLDTSRLDKKEARENLEKWLLTSQDQLPMLSRSHIQVKQPLSSSLASYFTVSGYFNPFSQEVQVNELMPKTSYPFTVVHELTHQMGIGFEDECNFVAFLMLHRHPNVWYRYAAYYETLQYLLRPLYVQNPECYKYYFAKLSPEVRSDYEKERAFWAPYYGRFNELTSLFYGSYLQHNNQPEGMARYSLMNRLVVAWERQQDGRRGIKQP